MRTRQQYGSQTYRLRANDACASADEMPEGRDKVMMLEIAAVYSQMAVDRARFEDAEDRAAADAQVQVRWLTAVGERINRSFRLKRIQSLHLRVDR